MSKLNLEIHGKFASDFSPAILVFVFCILNCCYIDNTIE